MNVGTAKAATETARAWWFFALTFLWTWAFWGIIAISGQEWTRFPSVLLYALGGIGPSLVAIVLVHRRHTEETLAAFWRRVGDPRRIPGIWYLAILGVAFIPNLVAKLGPIGSAGTADSDAAMMLGAVLTVAIAAGFAEELGWRGYALDRLLTFRSALGTSLVIGLVWTIWHLPLYFMTGTIQQETGLWSQDFWFDMSARIPVAVLFTWLYVNTDRSILAAVLLHAVDNIASVVVAPEGNQLLVRLVVTIGLAVLVVGLWGPRTLARRPSGDPTRREWASSQRGAP